MNKFLKYFTGRFEDAAKIVLCLVLDATIFGCWMFLALVNQAIAENMRSLGVEEVFAVAVKWLSSASTFILTLFYIWKDMKNAYEELKRGK